MAVCHSPGAAEVSEFLRPLWGEEKDGWAEPHHTVLFDEPRVALFFRSTADSRLRPRSEHETRNLHGRMFVVSRDVVGYDFEPSVSLRERKRLQSVLHKMGTHPLMTIDRHSVGMKVA